MTLFFSPRIAYDKNCEEIRAKKAGNLYIWREK